MTEDREKNIDHVEKNIDDVEGHSLPGQNIGEPTDAHIGQHINASDDDEPDFEGHALIGQNIGEPTDAHIGANIGRNID